MADPVTWGYVLMASSTAVGAYSAIKAGEAQSQAAHFNANVANQNAQIAQQESGVADDVMRRAQEQRMGSMMAAAGASGGMGDSGSFVDMLSDSARQMTLDRLTQQWNYKLKGLGYQNQATLDEMNAKYSSTAGYLNALGDVAGGGAKIAYMYNGGHGSPIPYFGG